MEGDEARGDADLPERLRLRERGDLGEESLEPRDFFKLSEEALHVVVSENF